MRPIRALGGMCVRPLTVLACGRHPEPQQLIAQAVDERARRVGEINLLAARHAAVSLEQALNQCERLTPGEVCETSGDVLASLPVIEIRMREWQCRRTGTCDPARRSIPHDADAGRPVDLRIRLAAPGLPEMDAALRKVRAHESEMLVPLRVTRHTPLRSLLREMSVPEQNSVQARVVFAEACDRHHLGRNDLSNVVTCLQITRLYPVRADFPLVNPTCSPRDRLLQRHAAKGV